MRDSGYDRAERDWYVEPAWLVDALAEVEPLSGVIWDPACGGGNIPKTLSARGLNAYGSDIADRGYGVKYNDFFEWRGPNDCSFVSNPPYGVLQQFIEHALKITTGKVCILARLAFLEGQARKPFFQSTPLARVWVSSRRASMPPGGTDIKASGGTIAYAWFVWVPGHVGPPTLGWL